MDNREEHEEAENNLAGVVAHGQGPQHSHRIEPTGFRVGIVGLYDEQEGAHEHSKESVLFCDKRLFKESSRAKDAEGSDDGGEPLGGLWSVAEVAENKRARERDGDSSAERAKKVGGPGGFKIVSEKAEDLVEDSPGWCSGGVGEAVAGDSEGELAAIVEGDSGGAEEGEKGEGDGEDCDGHPCGGDGGGPGDCAGTNGG